MAIVRAGLIMAAALTAPTLVLTPPLRSGTAEDKMAHEVRNLPQLAAWGYQLYENHCAACHGARAVGGTAPGLAARRYWADRYSRRDLHEAVVGEIPAHGAEPAKLSFNDIEVIGRYLRAIQQPDR